MNYAAPMLVGLRNEVIMPTLSLSIEHGEEQTFDVFLNSAIENYVLGYFKRPDMYLAH